MSEREKLHGIVLIHEPAEKYLNARQRIACREHRRDFIDWSETRGKEPDAYEGYAYDTCYVYANVVCQFHRHVWDERGFTLGMEHDDARNYMEALLTAPEDYSSPRPPAASEHRVVEHSLGVGGDGLTPHSSHLTYLAPPTSGGSVWYVSRFAVERGTKDDFLRSIAHNRDRFERESGRASRWPLPLSVCIEAPEAALRGGDYRRDIHSNAVQGTIVVTHRVTFRDDSE